MERHGRNSGFVLWLALGLLLGAGQKKKRAPGMGARSEKE